MADEAPKKKTVTQKLNDLEDALNKHDISIIDLLITVTEDKHGIYLRDELNKE